MTFDLFFHDEHPLVQSSPELILLDTSSPLFFHDTGFLRWLVTDHGVKRSMMGGYMTRLREVIRLQITRLMGMDIIGKYSIVFDYPSIALISFGPDTIVFPEPLRGRIDRLKKVARQSGRTYDCWIRV